MDSHSAAKKALSVKEAKLRAARYCTYQERSLWEVRNKLGEYGLADQSAEKLLSELIAEDFINEERFARIYASGKFRLKKWGKLKILQGLQQHQISQQHINLIMNELDTEEYAETVDLLIRKKNYLLQEKNPFKRKEKVAKYVINKGFEPDLVWDKIMQMPRE